MSSFDADHAITRSDEALNDAIAAGSILTVVTNSSMDNSTLESIVCTALASNLYTGVNIYPVDGYVTKYFSVPSCINLTATYLLDVNMTGVIAIANIAPSSVVNLTIIASQLQRSPVNWALLFDVAIPLVERFHIERCPDLFFSELPSSIPRRIKYFNLDFNQLAATIPSTMLHNYTFTDPLILSISGNALHGSIPGDLFSGFMAGATSLPNIDISFDGNRLGSVLPDNLFGIIPSIAGGSVTHLSNASFRFSAALTGLNGEIPANLFGSTAFSGPSLDNFELNLSSNQLNGTIPPAFISGVNITASNSFVLSLGQNVLEGEIPSTLIRTTPLFSVRALTVLLSNNLFQGGIPQDMLKFVAVTDAFVLGASNCNLTGSLPSTLELNFPDGLSLFSLNLASNPLTGTLADGLLGLVFPAGTTTSIPLPSTTPSPSTSANILISVSLSDTKLTGAIPERFFSPLIASSYAPNARVSFNVANAKLSGSLPSSWNDIQFSSLVLDSNTNLVGTLPSLVLSSNSVTTYMSASSTNITGIMPIINATSLQVFIMENTAIDFCSAPNSSSARPIWAPTKAPIACSFGLSACACQDRWPSRCVARCSRPSPVAPACPPSTYPGPGFYCNGTVWTTDFPVKQPTLNIPTGAVETVVNGDVASSTIIFNGLNSTLIIKGGCPTNLTTITIELTEEEAKKIGKSGLLQTLISYYATAAACNLTDNITLNAIVKDGGCRKVKAKLSDQNSSSLSAYFTMDSSKCNLWWIILVSVIAGLVVLVAIILALLSIFSPAFRNKVRPYSNRARQNNVE